LLFDLNSFWNAESVVYFKFIHKSSRYFYLIAN
jgi:hypothetical protein